MSAKNEALKSKKLSVKHISTEKDEARLKSSKTTKRGETRFGGQTHF